MCRLYGRQVNEAKGVEGLAEVRKAYEFTLDRTGSLVGAGPLWQEYIHFLQVSRFSSLALLCLSMSRPYTLDLDTCRLAQSLWALSGQALQCPPPHQPPTADWTTITNGLSAALEQSAVGVFAGSEAGHTRSSSPVCSARARQLASGRHTPCDCAQVRPGVTP